MSLLAVNVALPLPYFAPKVPILGQEVLKIHANINNAIFAFNVCELPKFLCVF